MKALIYSCIAVLSVSAPSLYAEYSIMSGGLFEALMLKSKPHTEQPPLVDKKNIFEHAEVKPSGVALPSGAEALGGPQKDLDGLLSNDAGSLKDALVAGPRDELKKQETQEDLERYGPVSEQRLNGDESLANAELDLKVSKPNPSAGIVRRAELAEK